jgi:membrane protease YdiL (CAAX protease family)
VLPALVALGCLCGVLAVRSGSLSRPILVHAGFNLLTTVQIVGVAHLVR